jgi:hypothetical protein
MKFALLVFLVGCMTPERLDTGPEVRVRIDPVSHSYVHDDDMTPTITLRTSQTMYEMTIDITTTAGERETQGSYDRFEVTRVEATATVPGATIPPLAFMHDDFATTFEGTTMIVLPGSVKGQAMSITARGFDSRGLQSNDIAFDVALR